MKALVLAIQKENGHLTKNNNGIMEFKKSVDGTNSI